VTMRGVADQKHPSLGEFVGKHTLHDPLGNAVHVDSRGGQPGRFAEPLQHLSGSDESGARTGTA